MAPTERRYPCWVHRIVDGDTLVVDIDLGFNITTRQYVRVAGINAPEINSVAGRAAKSAVDSWLREATNMDFNVPPWPYVLVSSPHKDKYGRRLGDIEDRHGNSLAMWMLGNNHATLYDAGVK